MDDDLGIRCGLEDGAFGDQLPAQETRIGEIAVVRDRQAAAGQIGEHRLHVAHDRASGRGIAHMTDGVAALQLRDVALIAEYVADKADMALRGDRKSTRLNSSHTVISYAVFCLKKQSKDSHRIPRNGVPGPCA